MPLPGPLPAVHRLNCDDSPMPRACTLHVLRHTTAINASHPQRHLMDWSCICLFGGGKSTAEKKRLRIQSMFCRSSFIRSAPVPEAALTLSGRSRKRVRLHRPSGWVRWLESSRSNQTCRVLFRYDDKQRSSVCTKCGTRTAFGW